MIRYKKYQNQTKSTPLSGKWLARAVADETLDTRALAEHMAKHNTPYSQGAIHGVLKDMTSCIKELLLDGKNVKLDDLAIFGVGIRGKPADTSKDWSVTTNVVGLRLKCRATGTLAINQLKLEAQLKELSPYDIESGNTGGGGEEELVAGAVRSSARPDRSGETSFGWTGSLKTAPHSPTAGFEVISVEPRS